MNQYKLKDKMGGGLGDKNDLNALKAKKLGDLSENIAWLRTYCNELRIITNLNAVVWYK